MLAAIAEWFGSTLVDSCQYGAWIPFVQGIFKSSLLHIPGEKSVCYMSDCTSFRPHSEKVQEEITVGAGGIRSPGHCPTSGPFPLLGQQTVNHCWHHPWHPLVLELVTPWCEETFLLRSISSRLPKICLLSYNHCSKPCLPLTSQSDPLTLALPLGDLMFCITEKNQDVGQEFP